MAQFHYQALNADRQPASGQIEADSIAQAVTQLDARGLAVQSIGSQPPAVSGPGGVSPFAGDDASGRAIVERAALEQHMSRVIERGRVLLPALAAYAKELPRGRRRRQLEEVLQILERGDASQAGNALATLPGFWIPLLGAATVSRDPGRILSEFLKESERAAELQRQWWLTLAYPLFLLSLAAVVLAAISFFIVPVFREMFNGFGLRLPLLTEWMLTVAEWISSGKIVVAAVIAVALGFLLSRAAQLLPDGVRHWFGDHIGVRFGRWTAIARFAQFTADLLEAELEPSQALRLAGIAAGNPPLRRAAWRAAGELQASRGLAPAAGHSILTTTILHALGGDIPSSARVRLLREISACYGERARIRLSWTRGIIEPVAICAIGLIVGVTVLALFMPLISLIQGLS